MRRRATPLVSAVVSVGAVVAATVAGPARVGAVGVPGQLVGTFTIKAGACAAVPAVAPSGSYFFMQPATGIGFVSNNSSPCQGGDYTPLTAGREGGLVTGQYQLDPNPTFNQANSLADRIIQPVNFFGSKFGLATTCADQQNAPTVDGSCPASPSAQFPDYAKPTLSFQPCTGNPAGGCLYGDIRALGATWNGPGNNCAETAGIGCFDQGAAADAQNQTTCDTGASGCSLSGSFNPVTSEYTLSWKAPIHGGAFNGFVGNWVLTGTFQPATPAAGGPPGAGRTVSRPATVAAPAAVLHGVLTITAGQCSGTTPSGSYFQMTKGGVVQNFSSTCANGNYSLISPGAAGGIRLDGFQANPVPTFDGNGGSLARDITGPVAWFGRNFSLATNAQDVQNAPAGPAKFPAPSATVNGSTLTVNLSSLNATWNGTPNGNCTSAGAGNNGCYLQGSPSVTGTYDPATRHYSISWTATIQGGAFNGATGNWHLEGIFNGQMAPR